MAKNIDYEFSPGKYNDLKMSVDDNGFETKMRAFMNLLHMRPGMHQDCPELGINFNGLSFCENEEIDIERNRIKSDILDQTAKYIDPDLITDVRLNTARIKGSTNGEVRIDLNILFTNEKIMSISGKVDTGETMFENIHFDGEPFKE